MLAPSLLLLASGASALVAQPRVPLTRASSMAAPITMAGWQDDPILDKSKPDPIFDDDTGYKGRVSYGFSNAAELYNGRAAMMGFTVAYLQEAITGRGVLETYGFAYDEGAVLQNGQGNIFISVGGFVFALALTAALSVGGQKLYTTVFDKDYDGKKLPFT